MDSATRAAVVNTHPVVVRRLLRALRRAGLIETLAGKNGGAKLSRAPRTITLLDIYDAVELRPVIAKNQRRAARHCPVSCQMKSIMSSVAAGAEEAVRKHLRGIPLAALLRPVDGEYRPKN